MAGAVVVALLIFSLLTVEQTNQRFISPSSVPKQDQDAMPEDKAAKALPPSTPSPGRQEMNAPASVGPRRETGVEAPRPARQTGAAAPRPYAAEDSVKKRETLKGAKETEKLTDEVGAVGKAAGRIGRVEVVLRVPSARFHGLPDLQADMKNRCG